MPAKCPKCELAIANIKGEKIKVEIGKSTWRGVSYVCPHCDSVLGVQADPIALKADIVDELKKAIQVWSSK
jgi:hypothetical protein